MRRILYIISILSITGCAPVFNSDDDIRLYLKELDCNSLNIEWFFYSRITTFSPDYILVSDQNKTDTICVADNIADVTCLNDTIRIAFYGTPEEDYEKVEVPSHSFGRFILVDTNSISPGPVHRETYKKE